MYFQSKSIFCNSATNKFFFHECYNGELFSTCAIIIDVKLLHLMLFIQFRMQKHVKASTFGINFQSYFSRICLQLRKRTTTTWPGALDPSVEAHTVWGSNCITRSNLLETNRTSDFCSTKTEQNRINTELVRPAIQPGTSSFRSSRVSLSEPKLVSIYGRPGNSNLLF